jgi:tRNA 2-thiouridine synthesizing protein A
MSDQFLDTKELKCPMPIIKISKQMRAMTSGQILKVEATDPVFKPDVEAWCKETKNELLEFTEANGVFTAKIKKA